jgi:hypothetical protein
MNMRCLNGGIGHPDLIQCQCEDRALVQHTQDEVQVELDIEPRI